LQRRKSPNCQRFRGPEAFASQHTHLRRETLDLGLGDDGEHVFVDVGLRGRLRHVAEEEPVLHVFDDCAGL